PPLDPKSNLADAQTETTHRFEADPTAMQALAQTHKLSEISVADYDAVFYPGGHGPLWDLAKDPISISLIEQAIQSGKPVAAVC
ncbi:DJ-1/PfpI family protein, partial [Acinetobacter ursingii]